MVSACLYNTKGAACEFRLWLMCERKEEDKCEEGGSIMTRVGVLVTSITQLGFSLCLLLLPLCSHLGKAMDVLPAKHHEAFACFIL